ncbi:MAG: hypothetical protein ACP5HU_10735 [Phycisphaerae bacterium]
MSYRTVQGYILIVVTGALLLAAGILIVLQWGNHAEFSFYGKNYSIRTIEGGQVDGGVNTAVLILLSAAGGILMWWCVKLLFRSARGVRRSRRDDAGRAVQKRVEKLEKAGGEQNT